MKFHMIAAATLLAGSTAALAQSQDTDQQQQAATTTATAQNQEQPAEEEEDPGEEIQCRTERVTGSLTRRRRTCMTRNEWAAVEAAARDGMNAMGRNASGGVSCSQDQFGGC